MPIRRRRADSSGNKHRFHNKRLKAVPRRCCASPFGSAPSPPALLPVLPPRESGFWSSLRFCLPDSARETVLFDTPISFAISSSVIKIPCHFLLNLKNSYIFIFNTNAVRNQVIPQSFLNHHLISKRRNGRAGASGRPARPFPVLFYCFIFLLSPLHTLLPDGSSHPEYPGFRRCP